MSSTSSSNNNTDDISKMIASAAAGYHFWDTIIQQQQQQLDQTFYNTFIKSIGDLSQDEMLLYHENNPAVLPIGETQMAMNLGPTFIINPFMLHHNVIKDDVFLAQPPSLMDQYDDNASQSSSIVTASSSSSSSSPPTQFLSQPTLDIFGTDIMLPPTTTATTTTTASTVETIESPTKRRKKDELLPIVKKKKKVEENTWTSCQLIEPITEEENENKTTVFQHLTEQSIDWCRYCGTTEGVNWRPGPWGKRTLCNKHGCDYKGYGLASRLPRLDLSLFTNEKLQDRKRPVIQHFCIQCQSPEKSKENRLIVCEGGCSRAYHQQCHTPIITVNPSKDAVRWYCSAVCKENRNRNKVVVELPRKHIPLMHLLKRNLKHRE